MANYGRGWDDGYGGQSATSIDAYQERQEIEAAQLRSSNVSQTEKLKTLRDAVQTGGLMSEKRTRVCSRVVDFRFK